MITFSSQSDSDETSTGEDPRGPSLHRTHIGLRAITGDEEARARVQVPMAVRIERAGVEDVLVPLYPDRTYLFGRAPESSFVFPSDAVSRLHGQLRIGADERWHYRDLNSRNGSYLVQNTDADDPRQDALRVGEGAQHPVCPGDVLVLANGDSRLVFLEELPEPELDRRHAASSAGRELERRVDVCASHRLPVFLLGPSGAGKTFLARRIHERSRIGGQFVLINCGRLPHDAAALSSELLGHVRGAFTGAVGERVGKLRVADGGTLFLDEVESLPPSAQDFLLDVLEGSGNFAPWGAQADVRVPAPHFRLISASKKPLAQSGLRPDLCQRLAAGDVITIPGIEERREQIPELIASFLHRMREEQAIDAVLTEDAARFLAEVAWPGQIRELEATVRAVVARLHAEQQLDGTQSRRLVMGIDSVREYLKQRWASFGEDPQATRHVVEVSRVLPELTLHRGAAHTSPSRKRPADLTDGEIRAALEQQNGNKKRTADALGIALNTLKSKMRAFGIE